MKNVTNDFNVTQLAKDVGKDGAHGTQALSFIMKKFYKSHNLPSNIIFCIENYYFLTKDYFFSL